MRLARRHLLLAFVLLPLGVRAQPRELLISVRREAPHDDTARQSERRNAYAVRTQPVTETIRVAEGGRATIYFDAAIPMTFRRFTVGPHGVDEVGGTVRYEALTRFVVRPTVSGEFVTLEVAPDDESILGESARLVHTARGRLGEWIAIGGADVRAGRGVWLKVQAGAAR
jgi:hypothetical protein